MSTNSSNTNFLLRVTLCGTDDPAVSRMLSVPSQATFAELHEAVAVAFGWNVEPCTSWLFKGAPNPVTISDNVDKLFTYFAALWTAPDHGYNVTPAQRGTQLAVGTYMKEYTKEASLGKYWVYDYNISRYPHAIEVIKTLANDPAGKIMCVGGYGHITRNAWQFAKLVGFEAKVKVGGGSWLGGITTLDLKMGGIQQESEQMQGIKLEAEAAKHVGTRGKRAASSESESAEADAVKVVAYRPLKRLRAAGLA